MLSSSSSNKQSSVGQRPVDWSQLESEVIDVSAESQMITTFVKMSFETVNWVGCHNVVFV